MAKCRLKEKSYWISQTFYMLNEFLDKSQKYESRWRPPTEALDGTSKDLQEDIIYQGKSWTGPVLSHDYSCATRKPHELPALS